MHILSTKFWRANELDDSCVGIWNWTPERCESWFIFLEVLVSCLCHVFSPLEGRMKKLVIRGPRVKTRIKPRPKHLNRFLTIKILNSINAYQFKNGGRWNQNVFESILVVKRVLQLRLLIHKIRPKTPRPIGQVVFFSLTQLNIYSIF